MASTNQEWKLLATVTVSLYCLMSTRIIHTDHKQFLSIVVGNCVAQLFNFFVVHKPQKHKHAIEKKHDHNIINHGLQADQPTKISWLCLIHFFALSGLSSHKKKHINKYNIHNLYGIPPDDSELNLAYSVLFRSHFSYYGKQIWPHKIKQPRYTWLELSETCRHIHNPTQPKPNYL